MNTLILATALSFLNPAEAAADTTNCKSLERYAAVVMHARQTGTSQAEISSLISSVPSSYQGEVNGMINTAYKKPRYLYSEDDRLASVNNFATEAAVTCYLN